MFLKKVVRRVWIAGVSAAPTLLGTALAECTDLQSLELQDAALVSAEIVPAGVFNSPDGETYELPAYCRVRGVAKPTPRSNIKFEVWLPTQGWNGRYRQTGSGGFSGQIYYGSMADGLVDGAAVAATDDGHVGAEPWPYGDASWALGQPQRVTDYAYRSIEATAVNAKMLVEAYYGKPPERSYFLGCSNGGRQALKAVQRFPDQWDGVLAGAPVLNFVETMVGFALNQSAQWGEGGAPLPHSKLPTVQNAALAACGKAAFLVEGIAADPRYCRFDPTSLICEGEENDACLTPGEAATLSKIYDGPRQGENGKPFITGFAPTTEAVGVAGDPSGSGWRNWIIGMEPGQALQYIFAQGFYRYFVLEDPEWDIRSFEMAKHAKKALEKKIAGDSLLNLLNATDTDLADFEKRGGKLLMYMGWAEEALPPETGIDYYESVQDRVGGNKTRDFFRLFMVPGMQHCGGGPGAGAMGQSKLFAPALKNDNKHDVVRALEAWVEDGVAPDRIIAAKYVNDQPPQGVAFTRPVCAYPKVPAYKGVGSTDLAKNFKCVEPDEE